MASSPGIAPYGGVLSRRRALAASLQIEEVSHRFSDRLSAWNYARVREA